MLSLIFIRQGWWLSISFVLMITLCALSNGLGKIVDFVQSRNVLGGLRGGHSTLELPC